MSLRSGTVFYGTLAESGSLPEWGDREVVLGPPLRSETADGKITMLEPTWKRLVVNGGDVESIAVGPQPLQASTSE